MHSPGEWCDDRVEARWRVSDAAEAEGSEAAEDAAGAAEAEDAEDAAADAKVRPRLGLPEALSRPREPDASQLRRNHRTAAAQTVDEETGLRAHKAAVGRGPAGAFASAVRASGVEAASDAEAMGGAVAVEGAAAARP